MRKFYPVRHYLKEPRWLKDNLASIRAGKGPLRLCWWRGTTCYVVNLETHHYRLLSDWSNILTDDGRIPFHTSLRCKRNGVRGRLTVHYTDKDGHEGMLKIDEKLNVIAKKITIKN